jgi:hypothetical protein
MKKCIISCLMLLLFLSCRSPNEPVPLRSPEIWGPVVTGIFMTGESGPEVIHIWGNPTLSKSESDPDFPIRIGNPFPNPHNVSMTIYYEVKRTCKLKVYLVSAHLPGTDDRLSLWANAVTYQGNSRSYATMLMEGVQREGTYSIMWSPYSEENEYLPAGFYRIYIESGGKIVWRDSFLMHMPHDMPASMAEKYSGLY